MDGEKGARKSERINKGIPPKRFGFEDFAFGGIKTPNSVVDIEATDEDGACGGNLTKIERTVLREGNLSNHQQQYAKSVASKANSKTSRRSIREHLKKTLEREAEIHEIEMLELKKKKEFLWRSQQLENELKNQEDVLSNIDDRDDEVEIPEWDNDQRKMIVNDWVNKIDNVPNNCRRPPMFESTRQNHFEFPADNYRRPHDIENTQQMQFENSTQNDVLIAALKALQTKEIKDLPTFSGEVVLEWPNFISEFRRSTEEFKINPSRNLRRLNKAIVGIARTSVQTLLTSPNNIEQIISHLEMSFGRREWILEHLVMELKNLPIMKEENVHQFQLFHIPTNDTIVFVSNTTHT